MYHQIIGRIAPFIGVSLFVFLIWHYDFDLILNHIMVMDYVLLFLAITFIIITTLLGAISVYILINWKKEIDFLSFLPIYWASWAFGLMVPGQVGDIAGMGILLRKFGIKLSSTIGRTILDKMISFFVVLSFAAVGILLVSHKLLWDHKSIDWGMIGALLMAMALLSYMLLPRIRKLFNPDKDNIFGGLGRSFNELKLVARQAPLRLLVNLILTIIKVSLTGFTYWIVFRALGVLDVSPIPVITLAMAAGLVAYLPISLNGLGTVEVTGILLFSTLGINAPAVIAAYLTLRISILVIAWIPTTIWMTKKYCKGKWA